MRDRHKAVLAGAAGIWMSGLASAAGGNLIEQSLDEAWQRASRVDYVAPAADDVAVMQDLFARLLRGDRNEQTQRRLHELGWTVRTQRIGEVEWTVIAETADRRSGRGLYAIADRGRHALQAPHVPSDGLTGDIVLRYADDALPRALAWNTVPRAKADLAHVDRSYFTAFSLAYARVHPGDRIIQIHGFDGGRRRTVEAGRSSAIISAAHASPGPALRAGVQCLRKRLDPGVSLYGQDVRELGGTTNRTAQALRAAGFEGFLHVELSLPMREALREDASRRLALFECLGRRG